MTEKYRLFPRYTTAHLKVEITFPIIKHASFYLENASLNGLQIYGKSKIITNDFNEINIHLSDKEFFTAHAYQVWHEEDVALEKIQDSAIIKHFEKPPFRCGLRLKFIEDFHYQKWLKFITALHIIHQKSLIKK
jgi:hypothetical protein